MSTTIDERVVEMRFDNKHFESNVATSMSTLEKLKQKLNLSGATKGLENLSSAAKNNNIGALGSAADTVGLRFNAMYTVADQVLRNITTRVQHTAESMVKALTLDPITTGFQEYETQINSVQTILSNTKSKGTTIDQVNAALDELNKYADLTIYNFTEMTRNIGTFTAAGIDLDTSVSAIQGIANLAAQSGSTSQQASTAMYQLSQALATGTVKLMDWNSVVNAGMGGELFQNALKETSELLGTGAEAAIEASGSFRESLSKGWLTAEVLTETLKKFTTSGAAEYVAEYTGLTQKQIEAEVERAKATGDSSTAMERAAEAIAKMSGKSKEEIQNILEFAQDAEDAATKVKTFTQLWDVLKESAQSGWSSTWKLIIGDFEEAKNLLTPLADTLTGFINKMSDARNRVLQIALDFMSPWTAITEKLNGAGLGKIKDVINTVGDLSDKLEYYQDVVNRVWRGDYKNSDTGRYGLLDEDGYDHRIVQDLVNKGYQYKLTVEDIEASYKKFGVAVDESTEKTEQTTEAVAKLTDEQLTNAGLTEEEIRLYRALESEADRLGISMSELADDMSENNGRDMLIDSFKNIGSAISDTVKIAKGAWVDIFDPPSLEEMGIRLYGLIASLKKFTESLKLTNEAGELNDTGLKLQSTFKGIFAVLDIVTTILGGGLKIAFKVLSAVLGAFDLNILDVTANIGDALVAFRDWLFENNALAESINGLIGKLPGLISDFKEWFAAFKETPAVQKLVTAIEAIRAAFSKLTSGEIDISEFARSLGENLANALKSLPEIAIQIGKDFIAGFQNGIDFSVSGVIDKIIDFCLNFVDGFKEALGVQSPSWKAYETATDFFQGFINGAKAMIGSVLDVLKGIGEQIIKVFKSLWDFITDESGNVEWGKIFAGGSIVAGIWVLKQLADAFSGIAGAFEGISDILSGAGKVMKSFSKVLNGVAWDLKAGAIQKMAISIGILVAAIWVLTTIDDPAKLWSAVGVIATLAAILVGLSVAMDKLSSASVSVNKKGASIDGLKSGLLQIGVAILLVAAAAKLIGSMDPDEAKQGFIGLAGVAAGMIVFLAAMGRIVKFSGDVSSVGTMMKKLAVAMILMIVACKLVGMLSAEDMLQGAAFATGFAIFVIAITKVAKSAGNNVSKVGGMVLKLTIAMALMVGVCKLASMLSPEEMLKGAAFAAGFVIFVAALVKVTKIGKKQQIAKLGNLILSISASLLMMVGVCKLVGMLSVEEMLKGAAFVAGFVVLLKVLVSILTIGNEQKMTSVAGTILAMSAAIAILAGVSVLLSFMDTASLAKGIIAVGLLSAMMTIMVKSLKGAQNAKGAILMMAIAIGVMAASIAALSFIDTKSLISAAGAMTIMMSAFALMVKSMKGIKDVKVGPLIVLTGVVLVLAGIVAVLSNIIKDPVSAIASVGSLVILMAAMTGLLKVLDSMKNVSSATKAVLALTAMAIPLLAFSIVLRQMNGIEGAMDSVLALTVLMTGMTVLLAAVSAVGKYLSSGIIAGIVSLTAMVVPMLAFVWALKQMDGIEDASEKITSLVTMMGAMTILLAVLAVVGLGGPAAIIGIGSLVALFVAIGGLAVAVGALMDKFPSIQKFLDTGLPVLEQLAGSIGTMIGKFIGGIGEGIGDSLVKIGEDIAAFMDQLAIASDNASGIKGESFDGVKKLMDVMGDIALTTVGTSIGDIFTLGGTSMEKFQTDGVAFFDAMKAIGEASSGVNIDEESMDSVIGAAQKLADLQSSLEPIGGVVSWFTGRDDLGTFGENIGEFISSITIALSNLDGASFNEEALGSIIAASEDLATLQSSLEPIGGVITWFTGRDDLGTFGENVGSFISSMKTALGSLDGVTFDSEALNTIISAATELGTLQSSMEPIGGVITWFTGRDDLGTFGENVGSFIASMKTAMSSLDGVTFNEEALNSIVIAATKLGELQSSLEPIGGVVDWFTGRDDLGTFGTSVGQFISSMKTALTTLDGATLNEEALTSVITAAKKLSELQDSLTPMGGVISWFSGRTDLGTFGTNVSLFADAMGKLKTGMGENGISEEVVASITNAGTAIIELQKALPEEGWFDGKMNLSEFSGYITDFANAMSTFATKAAEIDSGAVSTVINIAYRIKSLIESLVDIDTSGVEAFTGVGTGGVGADGPAYDIAKAIAKFSEKVADIDTEAVTVAVSAAGKLKNLIASLVGLDTSGIENFKPGTIGDQMKAYSDKVAGIDTGTVSSSISAANRLKNFIAGLVDLDTSGVSKFNPGRIGTALATYSTKIAGFDIGTVSSSISAANRLKNFISSLVGLDSSGVSGFKTAVESLAEINLSGIQEAFDSAATQLTEAGSNIMDAIIRGMESKTPTVIAACTSLVSNMQKIVITKVVVFNAAGLMMMTYLSKGIISGKSAVISATTSSLSAAASATRGYYSSFYSAGAYLVAGFAAGISANSYMAVAKARAMAYAAATAAKNALDINSPSKVFKKIGKSVPEGFAMGIDELAGMVEKSSANMTNTALDGTKAAIQHVSDMMSTDADYQPTITPVLDLTNVESGAGSIASMFNNSPAIGFNGNIKATSILMNENSQNGMNDEVVSAINRLRKDLGNVGNTTYSINGVTYDDGSNIHDAISAVVRQARIGRRV